PYVFCSIRTARMLVPALPDQAMYLLARCPDAAAARSAVERLNQYPSLSAFTSEQFSRRTRLHWLIQTNAGITAGFTAALGLLVGGGVTSPAPYAATPASMREDAVPPAPRLPPLRLGRMVLGPSFSVGLAGLGAGVTG